MRYSSLESDALHARARAFSRAFEEGAPMPEPFDALACDLARFQSRNVDGYARLCRARGVHTQALTRAIDAPAVPTEAFKLSRVAAFPEECTRVTFRTSGTTMGARGTHAVRDLASYDAGALAFGAWALFHDWPKRAHVVALAPSPTDAPDSSLSHMLALFAQRFGAPAKDDATYFVKDDTLDVAGLDERVARALVAHEPVMVLATSFALVHLLEALDEAPFRLPEGSRVMQTGGFKGKSREVDAKTLRQELARTFAIDARCIVAEYGMTELSSQFYEGMLRPAPSASESAFREGVYVEPPWARVVPVDPDTLTAVAYGDIGIARIEDLMNVDSSFAILAADRVRRVDGGFELLGRAPGAPPRGCSIAIDEILSRDRNLS